MGNNRFRVKNHIQLFFLEHGSNCQSKALKTQKWWNKLKPQFLEDVIHKGPLWTWTNKSLKKPITCPSLYEHASLGLDLSRTRSPLRDHRGLALTTHISKIGQTDNRWKDVRDSFGIPYTQIIYVYRLYSTF